MHNTQKLLNLQIFVAHTMYVLHIVGILSYEMHQEVLARALKNLATSIAPQELASMPLMSPPKQISIVQSAAQLHEVVADLMKNAPLLGFDTESAPVFEKGLKRKADLLQLAPSAEKVFVVKLSRFAMKELAPLERLFNTKASPVKCGFSWSEDICALRELYMPILGENCVDLGTLARNAGVLKTSLQQMSALLFGERVSKAVTLSNWHKRNLTLAQLHYAATDAVASFRIATKYAELVQDPTLKCFVGVGAMSCCYCSAPAFIRYFRGIWGCDGCDVAHGGGPEPEVGKNSVRSIDFGVGETI